MKSDAQREQERQEFLAWKQRAEEVSRQLKEVDAKCSQ